ncbi:hypothetical protein DM02DRAFT_618018 [Periconia macrospinosa]|uniref:Rhodopsin domain-containing protein n=1 Tax=Periconia macrospinosa TaxID=97972 RepID=A0A2V1DDI1_9PLEO|nr:hypothetical protein DM02DRAFT_618018 [Periconia macrospinosa]
MTPPSLSPRQSPPPPPQTTIQSIIPPPPNTAHNPTDDQFTRNITIHALTLTLVTLALALRIYTRARVVKAFGWDDGLLVFSWCVSIAMSACFIAAYREGIGRHVWDVPIETLGRALEVREVFLSET